MLRMYFPRVRRMTERTGEILPLDHNCQKEQGRFFPNRIPEVKIRGEGATETGSLRYERALDS